MIISAPLLAFLPEQTLIPAVLVSSILLTLIYACSAVSTQKYLFGIVSGSLRQRDNPYPRFFFFFPLISFNLALLVIINLFPIDFVRVAFFTVAVADGFAEPVGLKFGKNNQYKIKDFIWGSTNTKSLAGSSTVAIFAFIVVSIYLVTLPMSLPAIIFTALFYGLFIAVIEAFSPRGMDNMLLVLFSPLILKLALFFQISFV